MNRNIVEKDALQRLQATKCKECGSEDLIKYGIDKGTQYYYCKSCKQKFADNNAMPGRRIPPEQIGTAVSMYYGGMSLREIRRTFAHTYDNPPSTGTIYEWVVDYSKLAEHELGKNKAHTGHRWVADELVMDIGGKKHWVWDVMDADSRFLLATYVTPNRGTRDAEIVFKRALEHTDRPPKWIVTDRLASYIDGIERVFGSESKHVKSGGIRAQVNNNLSERLQGTIRQREKVMRGLKSRETAQAYMDGWTLHYNYFKPHEALDGKTPAEMAGIKTSLKDWEMVARLDVRPFSHRRSQLEAREFRQTPLKVDYGFSRNPFRLRHGGL